MRDAYCMITVNDSIISGNILFVPDKSFFT